MNDKRFTLKVLGVFLMEVLNFNGKELRKTIWAVILGISVLKIVNAFVELFPVFFN